MIDRAVFAEAQPHADPPVRAVHRPRVHPPRLPRRARGPAHARGGASSSWRTPPRLAAISVIDRLLTRPEFYDFWALKFADVLRSNGRLIQTKGAYVFHRWIRECLERNMPMDQFVRELLTSDGSTFKNPAANYYRISRDPETAVETTAQLFLGVRIQCAKCHNHPFERWTQDDYYGFAAFFSQIGRKKGNLPDEEVVYATGSGDVSQPRTGRTMKPKALGGPVLDDPATERPAGSPGGLAGRPRQPVLRQEPGQPDLVSLDRPRDRRAGRRLPRLEPGLQRRAARRPDGRFRQERLRPEEADPLDPAQPHLSARARRPIA